MILTFDSIGIGVGVGGVPHSIGGGKKLSRLRRRASEKKLAEASNC